jgi:hypothetical protein
MLRSNQVLSILLLIGTVLCSIPTGAQGPNLGWVEWDSSNQVLFPEPGPGLVSRTYPDGSGQEHRHL